MHLLGRTQNGIYRTRLNTQGTTDADLFIDTRHPLGLCLAVFRIQGFRIARRAALVAAASVRHCGSA
jgi:hypothetical protein